MRLPESRALPGGHLPSRPRLLTGTQGPGGKERTSSEMREPRPRGVLASLMEPGWAGRGRGADEGERVKGAPAVHRVVSRPGLPLPLPCVGPGAGVPPET